MSLTVDEIFERTRRVLLDEDGVRWADAELLDWYNEGLLDAVTRRPGLLVAAPETFSCVAGTIQSIPANRIALVSAGRNLGPSATPINGPVPTVTNKELVDKLIPDWQSDATSAVITMIIGSQSVPYSFWVYPPQPASNQGRLEMIFSTRPTVVTSTATAFELHDEHAPILVEYLLYRSWLKDSESQVSAQRSASHLTNYLGLLGANQQPQPQG